jgi:hypothetical protein
VEKTIDSLHGELQKQSRLVIQNEEEQQKAKTRKSELEVLRDILLATASTPKPTKAQRDVENAKRHEKIKANDHVYENDLPTPTNTAQMNTFHSRRKIA